jgi:hypothetical protein
MVVSAPTPASAEPYEPHHRQSARQYLSVWCRMKYASFHNSATFSYERWYEFSTEHLWPCKDYNLDMSFFGAV